MADWLKLRSRLAEEAAQWTEQKAALKREIELLERENASLDEELDRHRRQVEAGAQDDAALLAEVEAEEAQLRALTDLATRVEARLAHLGQSVPPGLAGRLPVPGEPATNPRARLAAVVETLVVWENLAREGQVTRALIAPEGETRREAEILYLGTSQGLAVSLDGRHAWLGTTGTEGWTWSSLPRATEAVRQALQVARKEKPPRLTPLPLQPVAEGPQP